ncbi:hypothetical protein LRP52_01865 [Photobacterium sp. ZSDE20]|uniref:Uncharacterized protein n=1 Tax=Photobacterium pectinilyticum TaxID=2906793 RepID=A0ABT1MVZ0_9GAMM|nr:hypothetical protein [Photobacterium sp. ZSDE20]MCQ1056663.1 hypothetical protein [Photobacterium sp. ZSDE20]MDD1820950.1 hypothetical protein [Photobacterium sp. ZSDE20]
MGETKIGYPTWLGVDALCLLAGAWLLVTRHLWTVAEYLDFIAISIRCVGG